jgi:ComF family protein
VHVAKLALFRKVLNVARRHAVRPRPDRWLRAGVDLVFLPECSSCRLPLEGSTDVLLCEDCRRQFIEVARCCPRCGATLPPSAAATSCARCSGERQYFESVVRLGTYDDALRIAVLRLKHNRHPGLPLALADLLAVTHGQQLADWQPDAIVPVPMHWSRKLWRGVNSPQTIAERLAARLNIPLASRLLVRRRRTAVQAQLSPRRRRANVRRAFLAGHDRDLPAARILLVDDVMTTGATVNEAAKTLARAGAGPIRAVVLARANGPP